MILSSISQTCIFQAFEIMSINYLEDISKLNIIACRNKKIIYSKIISLEYKETKVIEFPPWVNIDEIEFSISNNFFLY
ncbi:unnamed protein product [Rotaria sordida]|uniref:Uncharacterized protein n=1 Tax=Rotaria sordida TaxID=392033 RepID=A0A815CD54_9BILA|nr:unnamed protein product [Rotaria sordida]CAF1285714.1 unnamed protein product [Rotaria sordida]